MELIKQEDKKDICGVFLGHVLRHVSANVVLVYRVQFGCIVLILVLILMNVLIRYDPRPH
jgi:hypothetical protein